MTTPVLKEVEEAADDLAKELEDTETPQRGVWQIAGAPTTGKTAVLEALAHRLRERQLLPVMISPPQGAFDSGPAALVQLGVQLKQAGRINGTLDQMVDPKVTWGAKLALVQQWVAASAADLVILCDEPDAWGFVGYDEHFFAERTDQAIRTLLMPVAPRRVVAGKVPAAVPIQRTLALAGATQPREWLHDKSHWRSLATTAERLDRAFGPEITRYSQLQVRLLVALSFVLGPEVVTSLRPTFATRRRISERLIESLEKRRDQYRNLLHLWASLALVRRPFAPELLQRLGAGELIDTERDLLECCLLFVRGDSLVLHELLRADIKARWWRLRRERATHGILARYYRDRFEATRAPEAKLLLEMEAFHHAASSEDPSTANELRTFFVEQLDALAREISLRAVRKRPPESAGLEEAAALFTRATQWDDAHAYAHHYAAFNLDVAGLEAQRVEAGYRRAAELEPRNVWWRSRLISFLITRGRTVDAEAEWDRAEDDLELPSSDAFVYENLHMWVARLLIHRGQLPFAHRLLERIPSDVVRSVPRLGALRERLAAQMLAREKGAYVPLFQLRPRWWLEGPFLLAGTTAGKPLREWLAARIDEVDEGILHLRAARLSARQSTEPTYETVDLPFEDFDRWSRDGDARALGAGRFLEIGRYGSPQAETIVARVHPDRQRRQPELPALFPDPARYLRRVGAVKH